MGDVLKTPKEWSREKGILILDPDGWRFSHGGLDPLHFDDPITESEFDARAAHSTQGPWDWRNINEESDDSGEEVLRQSVVLEFYLLEDVTPEIFASKVAIACARGGAIRIGERVGSGVHLYERVENVDIPAGVVGKHEIKDVPNIQKVHP